MITSITSPFEAPVASGTLCVILDACFDMNLPTTLKHAYGYTAACCVPLFEGTPYAGLQAAGPYVLRCPAHGELADYARGLLERADAGYVAYLADDATLAQAVTHWRSLLTMRTDTSLRMLRFSIHAGSNRCSPVSTTVSGRISSAPVLTWPGATNLAGVTARTLTPNGTANCVRRVG